MRLLGSYGESNIFKNVYRYTDSGEICIISVVNTGSSYIQSQYDRRDAYPEDRDEEAAPRLLERDDWKGESGRGKGVS